MKADLQYLLSDMDKLSSVPDVYIQLDEAIRSSRASAGHISSIISQDSSLSVRLLKIVNSAFYSFPRHIDTISRAVIVVGTQQLRDLALATSIINTFKNIPVQFITMDSFWKHSIACGVASRIIASYFKEPNIERYFVAGMLHDIGRLIIVSKIPEYAERVFSLAAASATPLYKVEREVLGFDHAKVGSALIQLWKLPKSFEEIILFHHNPTNAKQFELETSVIHIADAIVHAMSLGNSGELFVPPINEKAWTTIGLSIDVLPNIINLIDKQVNDVFIRFNT
ncbi:MAG TPA: phosphohydrolase [Bacteroidetes bacterium]|nr:phosphohydrolase [Bacteroidota bacterium]